MGASEVVAPPHGGRISRGLADYRRRDRNLFSGHGTFRRITPWRENALAAIDSWRHALERTCRRRGLSRLRIPGHPRSRSTDS
jgi:hypothetical protein